MPATAGRVRMPANNRLSVSDSLRTSEIWQKSVGYDPYAPDESRGQANGDEESEVNDKARGLFALARLTGNSSSVTPGACRKCGQVGHLPFQCRNYLASASTKAAAVKRVDESESEEEEDEEAEAMAFGQQKQQTAKAKRRSPSTSSSSALSSSSDSDVKRHRTRRERDKRADRKGSRHRSKSRSRTKHDWRSFASSDDDHDTRRKKDSASGRHRRVSNSVGKERDALRDKYRKGSSLKQGSKRSRSPRTRKRSSPTHSEDGRYRRSSKPSLSDEASAKPGSRKRIVRDDY